MSMWIRLIPKQLISFSACMLICMQFTTPAYAGTHPWTSLTPLQQEALEPLKQKWDSISEKQQKRLLATTHKFQQLSPGKKARYHKNLSDWIKLSQEQRNRAREKYKAFKKVEPQKREEVKRMVLEEEAKKEIEYASDYKDETPSAGSLEEPK